MDPQIFNTGDGSHSLHHPTLNETYHSRHGAVTESRHVFIQAGLNHFLSGQKPSMVRVLEIGFGTGLNALLTMQWASDRMVPAHYTTLEAFPLQVGLAATLNYPQQTGRPQDGELFLDLHRAPWDVPVILSPTFTFLKHLVKLEAWTSVNPYDVIYYDAFAPSHQPELWQPQILERVCKTLVPGGVLVTYCAKGQLKRDLRSLGLQVESIPGPPGKREMVRAIVPS